MNNSALYPRTLGVLTLSYGLFTAWKPSSLLKVAQLEPRGEPSRSGRALASVIGARDTLSGLSMLLAPVGAPLQAAVAARVALDLSDVLAFGATVPPRTRLKVVAVAGGWGLLCATSWRAAGQR